MESAGWEDDGIHQDAPEGMEMLFDAIREVSNKREVPKKMHLIQNKNNARVEKTSRSIEH